MTKGYTRWTPDEQLRVACQAFPLIDAGVDKLDAYRKAQRLALTKDRHKGVEELRRAFYQASWKEYCDKARAMPADQRPKPLVNPGSVSADGMPPAVDKPLGPRAIHKANALRDQARKYAGNFRWTTKEKALLARMVKWFKDHGVEAPMYRLLIEAQDLVLPEDRRRAIGGLKQAQHTGKNDRDYEEGLANLWLIASIPFNPPLKPGEEAPAQAQEAPAPAEAPSPPAAAAVASIAPLAARTGGSIKEAAQAFADTVMAALDTLLARHAELMLAQVNEHMAQMGEQTSLAVAAMIQRGIKDTVHNLIEAELGPVGPPAPTEEDRKRKLKVDVVGFERGDQVEMVRSAFNGDTDLRFVHPDQQNTYAPHRGRHVVMMIGRVPHSLSNKIKAAGVEPVYVKKSPGHVIHAIEELHRSEMAAAAH